MLATTAEKLKRGDTFTSDEGVTWHTIAEDPMLFETAIKEPETWLVAITTEDCKKVWLWSTEEIVVRV